MSNETQTHCGIVALIGAPNAGKSTLTNALVGEHVSIVTAKVQTTRFPVRGIYIHKNAQAILTDTPGLFKPKEDMLEQKMVASALAAADDADIILYMVDAAKALRALEKNKMPEFPELHASADVFLVFNKVDLIEKEKLLRLAQVYNDQFRFAETFMICAKSGQGTDTLKDKIAERLPVSPYLFPEDEVSDLPLKIYLAELTREAAFNRLHQELPYHLAVVTEKLEEKGDVLHVSQLILIKEERHKPIILGKGGQTLKQISSTSRHAMEKELEQKIFLRTFVKVQKNWDNDLALLSSWQLS